MLIKGRAKVLGVHRVGTEYSIFIQTFVAAAENVPAKKCETLSAGDVVEVEIRSGSHVTPATAERCQGVAS